MKVLGATLVSLLFYMWRLKNLRFIEGYEGSVKAHGGDRPVALSFKKGTLPHHSLMKNNVGKRSLLQSLCATVCADRALPTGQPRLVN